LLIAVEKVMDKIINFVGYLTGILLVLMIINVAYDVVMRYAFHNSSIGMQEVEWHLFAVIILFGTGYALRHNAHVRVDFLYDRFGYKTKAMINIVGTLLFLIPLALLITYGSYDFVMDAYTTGEISEDPGGLTHRWIIKGMIPLAFTFLIFCAINYIISNINIYRGLEKFPEPEGELI
jgi:TRAP-type mannitol/chloroaromatic compound transport system permease small subunit